MKKKLTALALERGTLSEGDYADPVHAGLVLRVGVHRKTWFYRYFVGKTRKKDRLGYYIGRDVEGSMGLTDARDAAKVIDDRLDRGLPAPAPVVTTPNGGITLDDLLTKYERYRLYRAERIKSLPRSMKNLRSCLRDYLKIPAALFTEDDLRRVRDKIATEGNRRNGRGAPKNSNRFMAQLSPIFRWARSEKHVPVNICRDVMKIGGKETKRARVLTEAELVALWNATYDLASTRGTADSFGRMVRFLILTAQRRGEATALKHGHIVDGVWQQSENKSSRPHKIALHPLALEAVGKGEARDFVFAGLGGRQLSGFSKLKRELDRLSGVNGWTLHDLRRTAATMMQSLTVDGQRSNPIVIDAILNHAIIDGVGAVYMQDRLDGDQAKLLAAWAAKVTKLVSPRMRDAA